MTRMFELTRKAKMQELPEDQQKFLAKKIMQEVDKIAEAKGISKEEAYRLYSKGLYGADRSID